MTTIYSTGSTGTIGKHLPTDVHPITLDLSSRKEIFEKLDFESQSTLIHLAGVVGPSEVLKDIEYAHSVNIMGTKYLAEEFLKKSTGIFYFISTAHVYASNVNPISESSALAPASVYAEQKLEAETLLQNTYVEEPHRLCIIRVFSVLDWDVAPFTLGGAIRKLIDSDFILSNCSDVRDFLTPNSIAQALYKLALARTQARIVNLCSGTGVSVGEAAKKMLYGSGIQVPEGRFSWGQGSNPCVVGDNSLLLSLQPNLNLSWEPSTLN
jgi:nucleoside-diphosphate-sugar epimerase